MPASAEELEAGSPPAVRRVELPAAPGSVGQLRRVARDFALESGASDAVATDVAIAVTEAVSNAVVHAFVDRPPGRIRLVCQAGPGQLRVRVTDDGRGMLPRADSPGLGLGLSTMGALAASMDVRGGEDGRGTEIELTFAAPGVRGPLSAARTAREAALLDRASRLAQTAAWPQEGVEQVVALLADELFDAVTIDLVHQGTLRRLAARVHGDSVLSDWLADRLPPTKPGTATWAALHGHGPRLVVHDPASPRPPGGIGERLDLGWWLAVPLGEAGGPPVGLLGVGGRGQRPPPGEREQQLLGEVAERVAGGLATARALDDLRATRERLERILGGLRDGVTVATADGRLLYANDAAARLLHDVSARELLARPPGERLAPFRVTDEHGSPVEAPDLPAPPGGAAAPVLARRVHRASGRVTWTRTTTSVLEDPAGPLAVAVVEDVTDERRAHLARVAVERVGELLDRDGPDLPGVLRAICAVLVPDPADLCAIDVLDGDGRPRREAQAQVDGQPAPRADAPGALVAPLRAGGRVLGALTLAHGPSARSFDEDDARLARDLGRRIGVALAARRAPGR